MTFPALSRVCAPLIEASYSLPLSGWWQAAHFESSIWTILPELCPSPVAKLTLAWQPPQAVREGFVRNVVPCGAFASWHAAQLFRKACGYVIGPMVSEFSEWILCQ